MPATISDSHRSSKSALHGLVHWLASTYAKKGITVNGVAPALITDTAMLPGTSETLSSSRTCPSQRPPKVAIALLTFFTEIPIGRLGKPEEVAETVVWMVKTGYVTNKVIAVDGGMFVQ
jgi:3-oxoacyl-[acyl-carrier protein] reductase